MPTVDIPIEKTLNFRNMNPITILTSKQLRQVADLKDHIQSLENEVAQILGSPSKPATHAQPRKRRKMSAAARAKISAAAKKRWAKAKAAGKTKL